MKRKLLSLIAVVVLLAMAATPAFAHGHRGGTKRNVSVKYAVCTVESCAQTGLHSHSGKTYTSHYYGDGHTYHDYCSVEDCSINGYHGHDGTYHFGHTYNDGHSYHRSGRGHH